MYQLNTYRSFIHRMALLLSLIAFSFNYLTAQPALVFQPVVSSGLSSPVEVTGAGDGTNRLFIVEQTGAIRIYNIGNTTLLATPLINLADSLSIGGERGLLSLAFHPQYATNRYFFVWYTNTAGNLTLARFQTRADNPNIADNTTGKILLVIPHPGATNHNGAHLQFGPDGMLYFATGDGGGTGDPSNNAQNGNSLLGKMIRLDVNDFDTPPYYTIPADNPFVNDPNIRDEIWALGLRNPYRWSFDRLNGDMWIGDVGQGVREEIDYRPAGSTGGINYGWRCIEGTLPYNGGCAVPGIYAPPLLDYVHSSATGGFAVIGGYVYRGARSPAIYGYYIFADNVSSNVWLLPPGGTAADTILYRSLRSGISGFGEGDNGEIYATTLNGALFTVVGTVNAPLPVTLVNFTGTGKNGYYELNWRVATEQNLKQYEIQYSYNAIDFERAGIVPAGNRGDYSFNHVTAQVKRIYYRLKSIDLDGTEDYSNIISITSGNIREGNFVAPSVIRDGLLNVNLDGTYSTLQVLNTSGSEVFRANINGRTGRAGIQIPNMPGGSYFIVLQGKEGRISQKIFIE
jgi:glucose/arabinose dehydrogenase